MKRKQLWYVYRYKHGLIGHTYAPSYKVALKDAVEFYGCHSTEITLEREPR